MTQPKYEPYDFANRRHIGPSPDEMEAMLATVEAGDTDRLRAVYDAYAEHATDMEDLHDTLDEVANRLNKWSL